MSHPPTIRRAFTLLELILVLAVSGIVGALGLSQVHHWMDRIATHSAVAEASLAVGRAREAAMAEHAIVALRIDTVAGTVALFARGERLATYALGHQHGVRLSATRDSIAFDVRGLGYGAANMSLTVRRGAAVETLFVSRLGRTRY